MRNKHLFFVLLSASIIMFSGCEPASGFLIVGPTLESYNGEGGDIIIPEKVSSINSDVFQGKDNIISIDVSDNVYAIDAQSFKNCNSLSSITLPVKIIRIGDESFDGCDKLTDIYYDGTEVDWGKIKIGNNVFSSSVTIHFNDGTSKTIKASDKNNVFMNADVNESLTQIGAGYGRRAYIVIDKETAKTASQENFAEFLEMRVDGKDYNWFTIDFGDGTGIVFPGCLWEIGTYCKLQPEGMQGETIGYLKVVDRDNYIVEYQAK